MWGDVLSLLTLGGLLFFPAVVAPTVFKSLPEAEAGHFLRALFPRFYLFLIIGSAAPAPPTLRRSRPCSPLRLP